MLKSYLFRMLVWGLYIVIVTVIATIVWMMGIIRYHCIQANSSSTGIAYTTLSTSIKRVPSSTLAKSTTLTTTKTSSSSYPSVKGQSTGIPIGLPTGLSRTPTYAASSTSSKSWATPYTPVPQCEYPTCFIIPHPPASTLILTNSSGQTTYITEPGDTCESVRMQYLSFSTPQLEAWNPGIAQYCQPGEFLVPNTVVCVAVKSVRQRDDEWLGSRSQREGINGPIWPVKDVERRNDEDLGCDFQHHGRPGNDVERRNDDELGWDFQHHGRPEKDVEKRDVEELVWDFQHHGTGGKGD